jgi:hypothetical protein
MACVAVAEISAQSASAAIGSRGEPSAAVSRVLEEFALPVRHDLSFSARGFERRWVRQVRGLVETRFDADALPRGARLTVWTTEDEIIAFELPTPTGERTFATRVALERNGSETERWIFDDGSTLDGPILARPLRTQSVSSKFGPRRHPVYGYRKFHAGTDYTAPVGTPVHAIADGRVVFAGRALTAGNFITLEHTTPSGEVLESRYLHLHRITHGVDVGSFVRQGDIIGEVGQTGLATGPHLHFEVRDEWGTPLDPTATMWPSHERFESQTVRRAVAVRRALLETYEAGGGRDLFARILAPPGDVDAAPPRVEIRGAFAIPFSPPRPTDRRARWVELPGRRRRRALAGRDALLAA